MLDLERFARALRLRWLWHERATPHKPWIGMKIPCDEIDRQLFAACTTIHMGNGRKTSFWHDGWINGRQPKDIAPDLYRISARKNKTVAEAMNSHN